jgi:hypothetical protein
MNNNKKTKKRIVFSLGGKGGPGKTWTVEQIIDWYLNQNLTFHAIDLDNENNTLSRFYPDAEFVELSHERDLDKMLEDILARDIGLTLIDMRAASSDRIQPWLRHVDFDALHYDHGVRFTAIGVVDSSSDSIANIQFWAEDVLRSNKNIQFVIAQNKVRGEDLIYPASESAKLFRKTLDLIEIVIPKLEEWIHRDLELANLRVGAALALTDPASPFTKFMTRSRLTKYQQTVFAELEQARDRLVL